MLILDWVNYIQIRCIGGSPYAILHYFAFQFLLLISCLKIQYLYTNNISENSTYPIIGRIEIPSINVNYPIFSTTTDDLLRLGICKVYGPTINSLGNLCLAGHNYENHQFFSDLHFLKINDNINIFDSNNTRLDKL